MVGQLRSSGSASPAADSTSGSRHDVCNGRVLLIAYHFPPDASSTGRLRTLGFMRHLPTFGWWPGVLTAQACAYERVDREGLADVPRDHPVRRAFALDGRRHLGWRGKYWSGLAIPDRWASWWPDAVRNGLAMIREHRFQAIWSTYPIMTSHLIALTLSRMTGLPWIADFRDPVVSRGGDMSRVVTHWLERRVVARADRLIFTTPGAQRHYEERFPAAGAGGKMHVIPNGYEEEVFAGIKRGPERESSRCTLVHAGVLYRRGRNPVPFFEALAELKQAGRIDAHTVRVVLRASGSEKYYQAELERLGIGDLVELASAISYRSALEEQANADGLLLFQGARFNAQIPAKVYEYLRIGVPIFALTDPAGDTAATLRDTGGALCVPMDDANQIAAGFDTFLRHRQNGELKPADTRLVRAYSRVTGAKKLADYLNNVTG